MSKSPDRVEALAEEVALLRAELATLRAQRPAAPTGPGGERAAAGTVAPDVSRRGLFGKLAAVTAAGVGLAALDAGPAAAGTGNLQFGAGNDAGTSATSLTSTASSSTLTVWQNGLGRALDVRQVSTTATEPALRVITAGRGSAISVRNTSPDATGAGIAAVVDREGSTGITGVGTTGVWGVSHGATGPGVRGNADAGAGVIGISGSGQGVSGRADGVGGFGVHAEAPAGYGLFAKGGRAPLLLSPALVAGPPASGAHSVGEVYVDAAGAHWNCVAAGSPGIWVRPGFNPVGPARLLNGDSPAGVFTAGQTKNIVVTGFHDIPAAATAVVLSVSAKSNATGYATLWPAGINRPQVAQVTFAASGQWTASAVVPIGTGGVIRVYNSAGTTRIFLDVSGFMA